MSSTQYHLEKMFTIAREAMKSSYAPYSNFHVGVCVFTEDGRYFGGCNIENAAYGVTQCAEACAVSHMIIAGSRKIVDVVVMSDGQDVCPPCGACRQIIREFATAETKVHLCDDVAVTQTIALSDLLPLSFGPEFLRNHHAA